MGPRHQDHRRGDTHDSTPVYAGDRQAETSDYAMTYNLQAGHVALCRGHLIRAKAALDPPAGTHVPDPVRAPAHRGDLARRCRHAMACAPRNLGHTSIETTSGYLHPDDRHLASSAKQAYAFLSRSSHGSAKSKAPQPARARAVTADRPPHRGSGPLLAPSYPQEAAERPTRIAPTRLLGRPGDQTKHLRT